jgi:hypothetical protein
MLNLTLPITGKRFVESTGKTVVTLAKSKTEEMVVWVTGDKTADQSLLANIKVNEVGDKFTASNDSKTLNDKGKPIYLKGEVVTRQTQSIEFLSFAGNNRATEFAQSASAFGLQLVVQM